MQLDHNNNFFAILPAMLVTKLMRVLVCRLTYNIQEFVIVCNMMYTH